MDLEFDQDQDQIRNVVASWVKKEYGLARRQQTIKEGGFSKSVLQELGKLGLTALTIPAEYDGLGLGPVERMIVMEELGQGVVIEPLAQTFVCSALLSEYGDEARISSLLPSMAAAETLAVFVHYEAEARYDISHCAATATAAQTGDYTLTGVKTLVPLGDQADLYIVSALLDGNMALFLVQNDAPGLNVEAYQTQDGSRAGELNLSQTPGVLLTLQGTEAVGQAAAISALCACAEAVGIMQTALHVTVEYLNTRTQFGVPLSSFQALKHQIADMKIELELARSMCYYATLNANAGAQKRDRAIAQAMFQVSRSMRFVAQHAVQLHGGIGMTDEYIVSHCFRRLTQLELLHGASLHHLAIVSDLMDDSAGVIA